MKKIKNYFPIVLFLIVLAVGACLIFWPPVKIVDFSRGISPAPSPTPTPVFKKSPLTGIPCQNAERRSLAVMLSGDAITRPLSGLAEADLVFEMPVITGSINRFMAVYLCASPKEIGSIRSARDDFIPLARGLDAIYAYWGGSHFALDELNKGVMDSLDALKNPFDAFWRKEGIVAPHNGFSSEESLIKAAEKLGYRLENRFGGYPHLENFTLATSTPKTLLIAYPGEFQVKYQYDPETNSYLRWRGGTKEIDKNTKIQVAAKNVVLMRAFSHQIEGQYNDVKIEGQGEVIVYRNGEEIEGLWKKDAKNQTSKLYFFDAAGQEIKFVPGQIWVEIAELTTAVTWQ